MSAPRLGRTDPTPAVWDSDIIARQMLPDCETSARQRESETLQVRTDEIKGLPRAKRQRKSRSWIVSKTKGVCEQLAAEARDKERHTHFKENQGRDCLAKGTPTADDRKLILLASQAQSWHSRRPIIHKEYQIIHHPPTNFRLEAIISHQTAKLNASNLSNTHLAITSVTDMTNVPFSQRGGAAESYSMTPACITLL
jgi:hypothetical protein